jgi:protein-S-isoprenylcysteine O-methyltransferase Ste14
MRAPPPVSATSFALNCVALVSLITTTFVLRRVRLDLETSVIVLALATAVPTGILDVLVLRVHRRESTGLDYARPFSPDLSRVVTKLVGFAATIGVVGVAYWLFPEYHGAFYAPFFHFLKRLAVPILIAIPAYMYVVDGRMREPEDAYWQLGRLVLGRWRDIRGRDMGDHARAWLVKAFFLPLMTTYMHNEFARILTFDLEGATMANLRLYEFLYSFVFAIDLAFTSIGYILSLRIIDAQIRSAEPTVLGWISAIVCYQPFFSMFEAQYVNYGGVGFGFWLSKYPEVRSVWGAAILALISIYVLSTVAFGWRFSNLTHRGILTGGPYRFTKHPAYWSKNLSWWLVSVPWATRTPLEALRHCLLLLLWNGMYFVRARTEERHLSRDPAYVAYAEWMNDNGLLRIFGKIPWFRYRAPKPPAA